MNSTEKEPSIIDGRIGSTDLSTIYLSYMFADALHDFMGKRNKKDKIQIDVREYKKEYKSNNYREYAFSNIEDTLLEEFCQGKAIGGVDLSPGTSNILRQLSYYEVNYFNLDTMASQDILQQIVTKIDFRVSAEKLQHRNKSLKKYFSKRARVNISEIIKNRFTPFTPENRKINNYTYTMFDIDGTAQTTRDVDFSQVYAILSDAPSTSPKDLFYNSTSMSWKNVMMFSEESNKYDTASNSVPEYLKTLCNSDSSVSVDMYERYISSIQDVVYGEGETDMEETCFNKISLSLSPFIIHTNTPLTFKPIFTRNYGYVCLEKGTYRFDWPDGIVYKTYRLPMLFSDEVYLYVVQIKDDVQNTSDAECNGYILLLNETTQNACIIQAKGNRVADNFGVVEIKKMIHHKMIEPVIKEVITHLTTPSNVDLYNLFPLFMFDIKRTGDMAQVLSVKMNRDIKNQNMIFLTADRIPILYARLLNIPYIQTSKSTKDPSVSKKDNKKNTNTDVKESNKIVLDFHTPVPVVLEPEKEYEVLKVEIENMKNKLTEFNYEEVYFYPYRRYIAKLNEVFGRSFGIDSLKPDVGEVYKSINMLFVSVNSFFYHQIVTAHSAFKTYIREYQIPLYHVNKINDIRRDLTTMKDLYAMFQNILSFTVPKGNEYQNAIQQSFKNLEKYPFKSQGTMTLKECRYVYPMLSVLSKMSENIPKTFENMYEVSESMVRERTSDRQKSSINPINVILTEVCKVVRVVSNYVKDDLNRAKLTEACETFGSQLRNPRFIVKIETARELINGASGMIEEVISPMSMIGGTTYNPPDTSGKKNRSTIPVTSSLFQQFKKQLSNGRLSSLSVLSKVVKPPQRLRLLPPEIVELSYPYEYIGKQFETLFYHIIVEEGERRYIRKIDLFTYYDMDDDTDVPYDDEDYTILTNHMNEYRTTYDVNYASLGEFVMSKIRTYITIKDKLLQEPKRGDDVAKDVVVQEVEGGYKQTKQHKKTKRNMVGGVNGVRDFQGIQGELQMLKDKTDEYFMLYADNSHTFDVPDLQQLFISLYTSVMSFLQDTQQQLVNVVNGEQWFLLKDTYFALKGLHDMKDMLDEVEKNDRLISTDIDKIEYIREMYLISEMYDYYVGRFQYNYHVKVSMGMPVKRRIEEEVYDESEFTVPAPKRQKLPETMRTGREKPTGFQFGPLMTPKVAGAATGGSRSKKRISKSRKSPKKSRVSKHRSTSKRRVSKKTRAKRN